MSSQYFPPYSKHDASINVKLDLSNYATKGDVKNITHVDVSSFASKTNLKTEVDKLDTDKLKTTPTDLAKWTNAVDNELVKKTVYNAKVTAIESQIAGVTQSPTNNLAEITKLKAVDISNFVTRTKFTADTNSLDNKIDKVDKKILLLVDWRQKQAEVIICKLQRLIQNLLNLKAKLLQLKVKYLVLLH